jgi:hypothetical protein
MPLVVKPSTPITPITKPKPSPIRSTTPPPTSTTSPDDSSSNLPPKGIVYLHTIDSTTSPAASTATDGSSNTPMTTSTGLNPNNGSLVTRHLPTPTIAIATYSVPMTTTSGMNIVTITPTCSNASIEPAPIPPQSPSNTPVTRLACRLVTTPCSL